MSALQVLVILRARIWLVLTALIVTVSAGLAVALLMPKKYTASAAILIDLKSADPVSAIIDRGALPPPSLLAAQIDIAKSERVAQKVVRALNLDKDPAIKEVWKTATREKGELEAWIAANMQKKLAIKPSPGGAIVSMEYSAEDPVFAAAAANAFAQALIEINIELKVDQARQYSQWFGEQRQFLRENLEKARARLFEYQRESGIIARSESLDAETLKLQDLSTRLTLVQTQTADALSKQRSGSAGGALPEVAQHPLIAALKADIVRQEAKLDELGSNLGMNHPQYQRAAAELATLKRRLDIETQNIVSGFSAMRNIGKGNEAELKTAIEAQQRKVLRLQNARDQLALLQRDVEAAQASYDAVNKRFAQISLESQANQSNVSVFSAAVPPTSPSGPGLLRIMLVAIFLGAVLGGGAAVGLEMLDPRVRSADDLAEMLQVSVLGEIPHVEHPGQSVLPRRAPTLRLT